MLEHGFNQAEKIRDLFNQAKFKDIKSIKDLSGIYRCTGGRFFIN